MSGPDPGGTDDDVGDRRRERDHESDSDSERAHDHEHEHEYEHESGSEIGTESDRDRDHEREREREQGREAGPNPRDDRSNRSGRDDRSDRGDHGDRVTIEDDGVIRWFLRSNDGTVVIVRDILSSVAIVAAIGLLLFAVSGIWPPLVAVESGSMEPNMERGDLIFVVDDDRFVGDDPADETGVVTLENGQDGGHEKFGEPGDVIVFMPDGDTGQTPVIHRAHFWVDEGENWVDTKANEEIVGGATCDQVRTCPAPHDGFVTMGDNNNGYDQYQGGAATTIVHPDWVTGKAMFRIPWLGHIRLAFDEFFGGMLGPIAPGATGLIDGELLNLMSTAGIGVGASAGLGVAAAAHRFRA
ncbi:S26 family signal peptidase [Natrialba sp. SSL1]|uniref:S26 family signal peptidase n=1 Tax=Natrialba sp. SSL1 TaxID=1869245 RepID=UPI0008F9460D|nr:S26 family signal peptidase [Natrialba sp. SSL1]OIB55523.1 S26 family signal peptidase [Natrialba sp. SSL1]